MTKKVKKARGQILCVPLSQVICLFPFLALRVSCWRKTTSGYGGSQYGLPRVLRTAVAIRSAFPVYRDWSACRRIEGFIIQTTPCHPLHRKLALYRECRFFPEAYARPWQDHGPRVVSPSYAARTQTTTHHTPQVTRTQTRMLPLVPAIVPALDAVAAPQRTLASAPSPRNQKRHSCAACSIPSRRATTS
jgi:hypothetical protein